MKWENNELKEGYGLAEPDVLYSLGHQLYDADSSPKKFTRSLTVNMTPEMLSAIQELASAKDLPFNGVMGDFGRFAFASTIDALEEYLDSNMAVIWRNLQLQTRRLTRERMVMSIDELIDQQVEQLRFWTQKNKWREVERGLDAFATEISDYPSADWKEHAADTWLRHDSVRALMRLWAQRLQSEAPSAWLAVRRFTELMEGYAGV